MSVYVSAWAWKHSKATGNDFLVLLAIADQARDDGSGTFSSLSTIAKRCRVSKSSVQRSVRALSDLGELHVVRRKRDNGSWTSNEYFVLMRGV